MASVAATRGGAEMSPATERQSVHLRLDNGERREHSLQSSVLISKYYLFLYFIGRTVGQGYNNPKPSAMVTNQLTLINDTVNDNRI